MIPKHIAIIMDGNGRWAKRHGFNRTEGHRRGGEVARQVVQWCGQIGVEVLTLFAFGSDNWRRPQEEIDTLMQLFLTQLSHETPNLHKNNVQLAVIGDRAAFDKALQKQMQQSENLTAKNTGLKLRIAANYGGYWDICQATQAIARAVQEQRLAIDDISPAVFESYLSTAGLPAPDLFIRTSGECRISNFLLWQLSYTELYFTDLMWPDFDEPAFQKALAFFNSRERRFGCISEQLNQG